MPPQSEPASAPRIGALRRWIDTSEPACAVDPANDDRIDWLRALPFAGMHVACLWVFQVGVSATALWVALGLYALRMFAITGFYHRYFSHRSFRTSRAVQFAFALIGASSVQRGALWWAAHHRTHHKHSDEPQDIHSVKQQGFFWAHIGWLLFKLNPEPPMDNVADLRKDKLVMWQHK